MSGTPHDLDNSEYPARVPVDMNLVAAQALAGMKRRWHLEFDCEGAPFIWDGPADSEAEAIALGRLAILTDGRYREDLRLAICLERRK